MAHHHISGLFVYIAFIFAQRMYSEICHCGDFGERCNIPNLPGNQCCNPITGPSLPKNKQHNENERTTKRLKLRKRKRIRYPGKLRVTENEHRLLHYPVLLAGWLVGRLAGTVAGGWRPAGGWRLAAGGWWPAGWRLAR